MSDLPEDDDIIPDPANNNGEQRAAGSPGNSYEVGYGKPPKDTQFKPGQSGNPKGRPRRVRHRNLVLDQLLNQTIPIQEKGRAYQLNYLEAMLRSMAIKGVKGHVNSFKALLAAIPLFDQIHSVSDEEKLNAETHANLSDEELTIVAEIFERAQQKALAKRRQANG